MASNLNYSTFSLPHTLTHTQMHIHIQKSISAIVHTRTHMALAPETSADTQKGAITPVIITPVT